MNTRILSLVSLVVSAGYFVILFLPWNKGFEQAPGWAVGSDSGWLALAVVLVELLRQRGAWVSRGYELVAAVLVGAEALLGAESVANVGAYGFGPSVGGFSNYAYGGWIGMGFVV